MSAKVYVVTSGNYSDYSIKRIFARRAAAEAYIAARHDTYSDWNDVEEWDVTETVPDVVQVWHGSVYITKAGEIIPAASSGRFVWDGSDADSDDVAKRAQATSRAADFAHAVKVAGEGAIQVQVTARSEESARKALMDRAYQLSAERKGVVA